MQISDTIDALMGASTVQDDAERLTRIRALVTDDFLFVNPGFTAKGPEALSGAFGRFMDYLDSAVTVVRTSTVDEHHDHFRYTWARYERDDLAMEGCDFGWTDGSGRLKQLVVFDHVLPTSKDVTHSL